MEGSFNSRCPAVKRLLKEAQELCEATEEYFAHPVEDNLFEWHFTVRGPPETEFAGGVYHGRIIMPAEYPMKPPNIIFFTPNGRFETNKKICLSISGHHPETWQPSWSIRTALLAIIGFMPTSANGTLGALEYTAAERAALSKKSVNYICPNCGRVGDLLKARTGTNAALQQEAKEVSAQMVVTEKKDVVAEVKGFREVEDVDSHQLNEQRSSSDNISEAPLSKSAEPETSSESKDNSGVALPLRVSSVSSAADASDSTSPSPAEGVSNTERRSIPPFTGVSPSSGASDHARSFPEHNSSSFFANNILLSAAVCLLIALVLRRLFLLESGSSSEMEDIIL